MFKFFCAFCIFCLLLCGTQISGIFDDKSIKDPTYDQMMTFIQEDTTDLNIYNYPNYVCEDFARDVVNHAKEKKIRASLVCLNYDSQFYDAHSIVFFETTDKGAYFLEPQLDIVFTKAELDTMVEQGTYNIKDNYGTKNYAHKEYFYFGLEDYSIMNANNTPGFELLFVILAFCITIVILKRKRNIKIPKDFK